MENTDYLPREEALELLRVKAATLYAYVSRGLLRSVKTPDHRNSLYSREDVERLAARKRGATSRAGAASGSMRWGEPIVSTSITSIGAQGPIYRNRPALELARSGASFEVVMQLLLTGVWHPTQAAWPLQPTPVDLRAQIRRPQGFTTESDMAKLLARAVLAMGLHGRGDGELSGDATLSARAIVQTLAGCMGWLSSGQAFVERRSGEAIAGLVLRAAQARSDARSTAALNSCLVILADHELAAASFAARVAASTNSDLYHCVAAAICTHAGASASAATQYVERQLFDALTPRNSEALLQLVQARGSSLFGFNHPLYPNGDPRAEAILELVASLDRLAPRVKRFLDFLELARKGGAYPGLAVALTALTRALEMPTSSAAAVWIVSRTAGWIAHALEQRTQAFMLRPRAKYVS